ncbi:MAG: DNA recombination protein RmuC [Candidatus Nanohaloarchaea archaeon]
MIEIGLLLVAITLLGAILYLQLNDEDPEIEVDPDKVRGAVSESWRDLRLDKEIGQIENQVSEIKDLHTDLETMMKNPRERGEFGEVKLEALLEDHLPTSMYGIRERVVDGKTPDAYIRSSQGNIIIDSKFPLDNFERLMDEEDKDANYRRKFRNDVEKQLKEIERKYVRPEEGTAEYAFEFVPSERVYYYLVKEEYELLNRYTKKGVQVVSPLTLGHKLELIKSDVKTKQLSEKAEEVQENIQTIGNKLSRIRSNWNTYYDTHLKNAWNKASDISSELEDLEDEFEDIDKMEE